MKRKIRFLPAALVAVVLLLGVFGCSDQKDRFVDPPWLGGSSIETLEKRGNYKIFLRLMELADYKTPIEKQLFTLFVPNDEAFTKYFAEQGISSVEALVKGENNKEAINLFTLHVLRNPRSRYQMIYEYVWSEEQGPQGEYAALFFRKPTPSTSTPYRETVKYFPAMKGKEVLMYTGEKLVPLFSIDYFEDFFGALDGSDYEFMYPGSKWGDNMNWHNAMVMDDPQRTDIPANETPTERRNAAAIRTANGFIFLIDQVVAPMQSLEQYLQANQDRFGLYYDILQRFATYGSPKPMLEYNKEIAYKKNYDLVSNIAEEQGAFTGNEVRMKDMFSAYIPNNEVLQAYLDQTVYKTYTSLDSVPEVTLYYILQTQLGRSLGLISKISASYFNSFGDPMTISKSDIKSAHMCSNGILYEMNKVLEPNVFKCVPGTLFFNSNYSTFLYAMNQAGVLASLSNPKQPVTLLVATNDQLEKYGIRYESESSTIQYKGGDKTWKKIKNEELIMFCEDHIYNGVLTDMNEDRYVEMSSGNFIRIFNGQITGPENGYVKDKATVTESAPNPVNGILHFMDSPIKSKFVMGKLLTTDKELSHFKELLVATKLLDPRIVDQTSKDTIPTLKFLTESTYWTAFLPTNAAMEEARVAGLVPANETAAIKKFVAVTSNADALKKFLLYHFVRKSVIFDDGQLSGVFPSNRVEATTDEGTVYSPLKITNEVNNLSVEDGSGHVVVVAHSNANILTRKGVAHKISSFLKYTK